MKTMKRFAALLLVVVLMAAMLVVPANAADTGSITVTNANNGITYSAYKIFDLVSYNTSINAYVYKADADWATFVATYVNTDASGNATWKADASAVEFAKAAIKTTIAADKTATATGTSVTIEGLEPGFYLISSSDKALRTMTVVAAGTAVEVSLKSTLPTIDKYVGPAADDVDQTTSKAGVGDTVYFKVVVSVAELVDKDYVITDTLDAGFTLNDTSIVVTGIGDTHVATTASGNTFTVTLAAAGLDALKAADEIVITYTATLNANANIKGDSNEINKNTAKLEYYDWGTTTKLDKEAATETYTYKLTVNKTDGTSALAGAGFTLYTDSECTVPVYVSLVTGTAATYVVDSSSSTKEIVTGTSGTFEITGLNAGTYYLKETTVPNGYVGLHAAQSITITDANQTADITNTPGGMFPGTGGMGTTIFYTLGGIMVLAAVVFIVTRRRMIEE